ncbi:unnamed protein product, partial [Phaeothamnion confervicola]
FFFFSWLSTLGVWPLTLPARASEPCTLPMAQRSHTTSEGKGCSL